MIQKISRNVIARNLVLDFGKEKAELDVFGLVGGLPVCIECKSGEFRSRIERYQELRKKLGLDSRAFIVCVAGLEDGSLTGLSSMYKLTFVNESTLPQHLEKIC